MERSFCVGCKSVISGREFMTCQNCKLKYDLPCVNISSKRFKKLSHDFKLTWKCIECKSKLPKPDNSNTAIRALSHSNTDNDNEIEEEGSHVTFQKIRTDHTSENRIREIWSSEMKKDIETMIEETIKRKQLTATNSQCLVFQESLTFLSGQYEDLKKLLDTTSTELKSIKEENKTLKENINSLTARVKAIEDENIHLHQWVRLQNVEIIGIPEKKDENITAIVQKVSQHIGVHIEPSDLEFAHRVQPQRAESNDCPRPIIVRLRQRAIKDYIIAAARKYRDLNTCAVGMEGESHRIFINDHLTKDNKMLLTSCKQKAKELKYKYVWTKNCRIFCKKNETSAPIPIVSVQDLLKIV